MTRWPARSSWRTSTSPSKGTDYFAGALAPSPLLHYWSLAVEEQFYFIFPTIVMAGRVGGETLPGGPSWRPRLSWVVAASFAFSIYETRINPTSASYSLATRAWELGLGVLCAGVVHQFRSTSLVGRSRSRVGVARGDRGLGLRDACVALSRLGRRRSRRGRRRSHPGRRLAAARRRERLALASPGDFCRGRLLLALSLALIP
jgi:hypothetical protein